MPRDEAHQANQSSFSYAILNLPAGEDAAAGSGGLMPGRAAADPAGFEVDFLGRSGVRQMRRHPPGRSGSILQSETQSDDVKPTGRSEKPPRAIREQLVFDPKSKAARTPSCCDRHHVG